MKDDEDIKKSYQPLIMRMEEATEKLQETVQHKFKSSQRQEKHQESQKSKQRTNKKIVFEES
jgi:hypothetical protein